MDPLSFSFVSAQAIACVRRNAAYASVNVVMATEPLRALTEQSAGVGAWMVRVATEPEQSEYTWQKQGRSGKGCKFECLLVSEDSEEYCMGTFKRLGKEPKATQDFKEAKEKFKKMTTWKMCKVALTRQNPKYLGTSCKVVIDMNTSTFMPVLQGTVKMPMQPTPPDDLNTLLNLPDGQVVDVIALVLDVTPPETKTTQYGRRDLVNISILDDSGENGAAISVFPAWFPKSTSGDHCAALKKIMDASKSADPVAFFNLIFKRPCLVLQSMVPQRKLYSRQAERNLPLRSAPKARRQSD